MTRIALVLMFLGCVAASGMALSSDANLARQPNSETSASSKAARPGEAEQATPFKESKGEKEATTASEGRSRRVSRKLQLPTPARSKLASHLKQVPKDIQHDRENLNSVHQSTATRPAIHAVKVANTHSLVIRPGTGSTIDGRQFRPGRNTAGATAIGGSANARTNAQALNGTGAPRRH